MDDGAEPLSTDKHVGARVRLRRLLVGMSQDQLASRIGVSFQQVQKYERGSNRIGASRLVMIADALDVEPGFLLEGLGKSNPRSRRDRDQAQVIINFLQSPDGVELAKSFLAISDRSVRRRLLELARALSKTGAG